MIIFLLSCYYRSHSILFITGFFSLIIIFICSLLFFFFFFIIRFSLWSFWRFFGFLGLFFLCYHAIGAWCTNSPMITPLGESCRCCCGYADCTDWILLFESFIDFNGCHSFSLFGQFYAIVLRFKLDSGCDFCCFFKKNLFTLWLTAEYLHFIWLRQLVRITWCKLRWFATSAKSQIEFDDCRVCCLESAGSMSIPFIDCNGSWPLNSIQELFCNRQYLWHCLTGHWISTT